MSEQEQLPLPGLKIGGFGPHELVRSTSTPIDVLTAGGIQRPSEVVELALSAGLELAAAAVLLEKESSGGRNVWGHDSVPTAGTYTPGSTVTQTAYLAYRSAVRASRAGRQGVGPCQLTYGPYQDQADTLGGCWDWRANCTVGFRVLADAISIRGVRDGFRSYNGSGLAAERYADDAMTRLTRWRSLLSHTSQVTTDPPSSVWTRKEHAWGGGITDEWDSEYDLFDFVRRNNVEVHQVLLKVTQLLAQRQTALAQLAKVSEQPAFVGPGVTLSRADINSIADAVVGKLAARLGRTEPSQS